MKKTNEQGITVIALIVAVIILVLLASISIGVLNNGLIDYAGSAKENTDIVGEKEILKQSILVATVKSKFNSFTEEGLQQALDTNVGEAKTEVASDGNSYVVEFIDTGRYYEVDKNGQISEYEFITDNNPGNIRIGINGETLTGDESSPFEIWCIEDLVEWSQHYSTYQTSYIKLGRTLNFNLKTCYTDGKMLGCTSINELKTLLTDKEETGFPPINEFAGNFDGQGFEIQNIYIAPSSGYASLIKKAGGEIKNLGITGEIISQNSYAAAFCGMINSNSNIASSLSLINCYNKANITSLGGTVGGLIGEESIIDITILNCFNSGNITSTGYGGGLIGYGGKGSISIYNSYNVGDVSSKNAGGLIGGKYHNVTTIIQNSYSYANIEGVGDSPKYGELIGYNYAYSAASSAQIDNVLYFKQPLGTNGSYSAGTPTYCSDITDDSVVESLNDYISDNQENTTGWRTWIKGEKGYPVFE